MKTKIVIYEGREFETTFGPREIKEIEESADFCKLNGFGEAYFLNDLSFRCREWSEEALEIFRNRKAPELRRGVGCTINLYSDRLAATITEVISPRKIKVKKNQTECKDYYASSYEILQSLWGEEETYTLRKGGMWVAIGQPKKSGSVTLTVGYQHHYIDPSF